MEQSRGDSYRRYTGSLWLLVLVLGLASANCFGQEATNATNQPKFRNPAAEDDRYRIGPGDLLTLSTLDYPQLSSEAIRVDSRGLILIPMLDGEIEAACKTEGELAREISKRYTKYLREPQVTVFVKEYQSQTVAVMGAVHTPGRFQLQRRVRLVEMLTFAGGAAEQAGRSIQIIHAGTGAACGGAVSDDQTSLSQIVTLDLNETMRGSEAANPYVMAGDIITIPDADQYFVLGNVAKPAAYPMKDKISLTQAIAAAGGVMRDTKTDGIKIVRRGPGSEGRTELVVDLKRAAKDGSEVWLQPNDIIEIPKEGGVGMGLKTMFRTMVPALTMLPLRVVY